MRNLTLSSYFDWLSTGWWLEIGKGVVNVSGWDTLKHENAGWLDGLLACGVLSQPANQLTVFGADNGHTRYL